jgi:hypothetical protein
MKRPRGPDRYAQGVKDERARVHGVLFEISTAAMLGYNPGANMRYALQRVREIADAELNGDHAK